MIKQTEKLALSKCRVESVTASTECHRLVAESKGCELDETENGKKKKKKGEMIGEQAGLPTLVRFNFAPFLVVQSSLNLYKKTG